MFRRADIKPADHGAIAVTVQLEKAVSIDQHFRHGAGPDGGQVQAGGHEVPVHHVLRSACHRRHRPY
jgi:hypothetical protein